MTCDRRQETYTCPAGGARGLAVVAITVAGGLLRLLAIGSKGLWLDEAFSIWLAGQPLQSMLRWVVRIDQHPPAYYTLLHFWISLGDAEGTVRALSALFGTLTIPVVYLIGRKLLGGRAGLVAAAILAVSPFHVQFAQEARMYTLLCLSVALGMLALTHLLTAPDPKSCAPQIKGSPGLTEAGQDGAAPVIRIPGSRAREGWAWTGYILFTVGALLTHNAAVLWPLSANLFVLGLIWRRRRQGGSTENRITPPSLRAWLIAQALVLLLWSLWLPSFAFQAAGVYREFWIPQPSLGSLLALVGTFLGTHMFRSIGWAAFATVLLVPLAVLGSFALRNRPAVLCLLLTLLLTPIAGELLVSLLRPIFYDRTLIWASIPLYLLLAAGVDWLSSYPRRVARHPELGVPYRLAVVPALALLFAASGASLFDYYVNYEKEGWREAAAYVARQAQADDLILFNATWVQIPFDYYFRRSGLSLAEHGLPVDLFDRGVLEPKMAAGDLTRLQELIRDRERIWLVYSHNWYTDPAGLIPAALDRWLTPVAQSSFNGLEVRLYGR